MCQSHNPRVIDGCMREQIKQMQSYGTGTLACCCGHRRYSTTIVIGFSDGSRIEMLSGKSIPRKRRFYKKDKKGYYYIPEVDEEIK